MAHQPSSVAGEHIYKGIRWPNVILDSSIDAMETFEVRPDDVWVCTYPKSGTHWMAEVAGLILVDGHPEKINRTTYTSTVAMINMAQDLAWTSEEEKQRPINMEPFLNIVEKAPSPRVILAHLPLKLLPPNLQKRAKVLYVARNPKDMVTSAYNFVGNKAMSGFLKFEDMLAGCMSGDTVFGPWYEHVVDFWKIRDEPNVYFAFYEDMKKEPLNAARQVAKTLGRTLSEEALQRVVEHSSFKGMKKTYDKAAESSEKGKFLTGVGGKVSFMNKGVSGGWKNRFTVAQSEAMDKWLAEKTKENPDLTFQFE